MRKNFTKLVCLAAASLCALSVVGQERMSAIGMGETRVAVERDDVRLRVGEVQKPDSILTYTAAGELTTKTLYEYGEDGKIISQTTLNLVNNNWENVSKRTYEYDGDDIIESLCTWEDNEWNEIYSRPKTVFDGKVRHSKSEINYPNPTGFDFMGFGFYSGSAGYWDYEATATYNSMGYITYVNFSAYEIANPSNSYTAFEFSITYNSDNQPTLIIGTNPNRNPKDLLRVEYRYDTQGEMIYYEKSQFDQDTNTWEITHKYEKTNGEIVVVGGPWANSTGKTISKTDSDGNVYTDQYYSQTGNKWYLTHYRVYYPNSLAPTIEPENNTPVGDSNQGGFDLDINIPSDSINNGSLVITLPDGFTLDEANTSLTIDFASDFALKITKQDNNSWLLEITPKSTRSASLRADAEAKTLLNVAYKVDGTVQRGNYDIVVNNILFESKGGNNYPEPAITIPAEVTRFGVSNEQLGTAAPKAYIANNTLYITAPQTEQIAVYTLTGVKLYEATISAGTTTINASAFPQGILIVKGSNGSATKVINY